MSYWRTAQVARIEALRSELPRVTAEGVQPTAENDRYLRSVEWMRQYNELNYPPPPEKENDNGDHDTDTDAGSDRMGEAQGRDEQSTAGQAPSGTAGEGQEGARSQGAAQTQKGEASKEGSSEEAFDTPF